MQKRFSSHLNYADLLTFGLGETEGKATECDLVGSVGKRGEGFSGDGREMGQGEDDRWGVISGNSIFSGGLCCFPSQTAGPLGNPSAHSCAAVTEPILGPLTHAQ